MRENRSSRDEASGGLGMIVIPLYGVIFGLGPWVLRTRSPVIYWTYILLYDKNFAEFAIIFQITLIQERPATSGSRCSDQVSHWSRNACVTGSCAGAPGHPSLEGIARHA
jgi:hypothetical protein